jgi:hypothetical protein
MNDKNPEPESQAAPGEPEPGGVPPEETPPGEGGLSGTGPAETYHNPVKGWGAAPLIVLMVVVLLFAVFFIVGYLTR